MFMWSFGPLLLLVGPVDSVPGLELRTAAPLPEPAASKSRAEPPRALGAFFEGMR